MLLQLWELYSGIWGTCVDNKLAFFVAQKKYFQKALGGPHSTHLGEVWAQCLERSQSCSKWNGFHGKVESCLSLEECKDMFA